MYESLSILNLYDYRKLVVKLGKAHVVVQRSTKFMQKRKEKKDDSTCAHLGLNPAGIVALGNI